MHKFRLIAATLFLSCLAACGYLRPSETAMQTAIGNYVFAQDPANAAAFEVTTAALTITANDANRVAGHPEVGHEPPCEFIHRKQPDVVAVD